MVFLLGQVLPALGLSAGYEISNSHWKSLNTVTRISGGYTEHTWILKCLGPSRKNIPAAVKPTRNTKSNQAIPEESCLKENDQSLHWYRISCSYWRENVNSPFSPGCLSRLVEPPSGRLPRLRRRRLLLRRWGRASSSNSQMRKISAIMHWLVLNLPKCWCKKA